MEEDTYLREKLCLPIVGGEIIARYSPPYEYQGKQWEGGFWWEIEFIFPGPDARYNQAVAKLSFSAIDDLVAALEEALQKMKILESQSFSGTYSKRAGQIYNPTIEITAQGGKTWVSFVIHSDTQEFDKHLSANDIEVIIAKLKSVEQQAQIMINTLAALV